MTAGLTITGAQILQGAGILSGITIMASIIGKSGGYTVKKFPNDHDPTHVIFLEMTLQIKHMVLELD